jgi:glucose dehydrogenase
MGGSVTTRSGLTFIAATQDNFLRAFETKTGREIWRSRLPASGQATPAIYRSPSSGRQFVVIATGGHPALMTTPGSDIVAFALPRAN